MQTNCLSYTLAALSSHNSDTRGAAYHLLTAFYYHLEGAHIPEQQQTIYILDTLRNSIEKPNIKLPCIISLFFARVVLMMFKPGMYNPTFWCRHETKFPYVNLHIKLCYIATTKLREKNMKKLTSKQRWKWNKEDNNNY